MINQVGMQLYTLRNRIQGDPGLAGTFKRVSDIGYRNVQVSGIGPQDPKEVKRIADDCNLKIAATHTGSNELDEDFAAVVKKHQLWDCDQVCVPGIPTEMRSAEGFTEFAKKLNEFGKQLVKEGMTLSYHNHAHELEKFGEKTALDILYDTSEPAYLQAEIDTYWIQYGGGDPAAWCRKMKNRLPLVHLKDYGIIDNKPTFMEIGEGNLNWPAIFDACREAGAKWYLVEQDTCQREEFESAKISFDNMKKMFAEWGY